LKQARSIECRAQRLLSGWPPPTRSGFCGVVAVGGTEEGGGAVAAEEGRCDGGGGGRRCCGDRRGEVRRWG